MARPPNTYTQRLISFIPLINDLISAGFSYPEIAQSLIQEYGLTFTNKDGINQLRTFMNNAKLNKLNVQFDKYVVLVPSLITNKEKYSKFSIEHPSGFWFTKKVIMDKFEGIATIDNIYDFTSVIPAIIVKRLMRFHNTPDSEIIQGYKDLYGELGRLDEEGIAFVKSIHENILTIFNGLVNDLKIKLFNFYKGVYDGN